ncbi:class I SAM-dependent methyltransferase [Propionibacterium australiense]|uniref:Methyltransferase domain n=1 Tax=Propionibacterium australiense TaxID=119981 RepID=A0A383S7M3_9ACTN|nr:class I SAM-dependent methyltransferase [Propionibacterium australiense]RLP09655.1 methyltransferase domain-containing protein [Propionibacterium australiense]RLP12357.1 methyltransferase domain-containing protein [Propionibacterium australiense]SYZ33562.1 Methyltransferase domain [Propionibacterium australiense]VEH89569.1 3-demethylubiquinone-9 3-methyltransferase [Propionibacterium australiense]
MPHDRALSSGPSDVAAAAEWDERYSRSEHIWSGEPNGALVDEVSGLTPGRALDVGCGEGADAIWLAVQGWRVTALDVSIVALYRALKAAAQAGAEIEWLHAGLLDADLEPATFDLVTAQYPALRRTQDQAAERLLMSLVAPGGILLFVHHDLGDAPDPEHFAGHVMPEQMLAAIGPDWVLERHQRRERRISGGAGSHHGRDIVVRARRMR